MRNRELHSLIAKILALGAVPGNSAGPARHALSGAKIDPEEVLSTIRESPVNWEQFVYIASNNFVLQTLYLKFRRHGITGVLPAGLADHLQHVHSLNLERNKKILDQCSRINQLLKSNDINPIFMKGTGNLLDGLYSDPGERIMSDIDILTGPGQMEEAARLLIQEGYSAPEKYDPSRTEAMKHYPGLRCEGQPAFVELHRLPVNIQYSALFDYQVVAGQCRSAATDPSFTVMSDAHKIKLNFYHSQLVHWGHQHARPSLRELYDLLLLSGREDPATVFSHLTRYRGKAAGYLRVMQKTFGITASLPLPLQGKGHGYLIRHNIALKNPPAGKLIFRLLRASKLYVGIPVRSLFSRNYRLYVKVRLRDPRWYRRNLGISLFTRNRQE